MIVDGAQVADVERGGVAAQSAVFQPLFIALYRCPIDFLQWHIASFQVTLEAVEVVLYLATIRFLPMRLSFSFNSSV